jgi:hypothetical protein
MVIKEIGWPYEQGVVSRTGVVIAKKPRYVKIRWSDQGNDQYIYWRSMADFNYNWRTATVRRYIAEDKKPTFILTK